VEYQQRNYSCGPAAVRAALYVLGHSVQEATIRKWAKTTPEGTDEHGIMRAIHQYGHGTTEFQSDLIGKSWEWLRSSLRRGRPVLICVKQWNHWETVIGTLGKKVIVFDPDRPPAGQRRKYSGLKFYSQADLMPRWGCLDEDGKNYYYGISIY